MSTLGLAASSSAADNARPARGSSLYVKQIAARTDDLRDRSGGTERARPVRPPVLTTELSVQCRPIQTALARGRIGIASARNRPRYRHLQPRRTTPPPPVTTPGIGPDPTYLSM